MNLGGGLESTDSVKMLVAVTCERANDISSNVK